jgi:hypothetical protein
MLHLGDVYRGHRLVDSTARSSQTTRCTRPRGAGTTSRCRGSTSRRRGRPRPTTTCSWDSTPLARNITLRTTRPPGSKRASIASATGAFCSLPPSGVFAAGQAGTEIRWRARPDARARQYQPKISPPVKPASLRQRAHTRTLWGPRNSWRPARKGQPPCGLFETRVSLVRLWGCRWLWGERLSWRRRARSSICWPRRLRRWSSRVRLGLGRRCCGGRR